MFEATLPAPVESGDWIKAWRVRVGKRLQGKKLTHQQASKMLSTGETGSTVRAWETRGGPIPKSAILAMMAVDTATWYSAENYAPPPPVVEILNYLASTTAAPDKS